MRDQELQTLRYLHAGCGLLQDEVNSRQRSLARKHKSSLPTKKLSNEPLKKVLWASISRWKAGGTLRSLQPAAINPSLPRVKAGVVGDARPGLTARSRCTRSGYRSHLPPTNCQVGPDWSYPESLPRPSASRAITKYLRNMGQRVRHCRDELSAEGCPGVPKSWRCSFSG